MTELGYHRDSNVTVLFLVPGQVETRRPSLTLYRIRFECCGKEAYMILDVIRRRGRAGACQCRECQVKALKLRNRQVTAARKLPYGVPDVFWPVPPSILEAKA